MEVQSFLPEQTKHYKKDGRDVWVFSKNTELGINFQIALYYDADESTPGYCARLLSPEIEKAWMSPHVGHLFADGAICFGAESMRTRRSLREAFSKSCLWAEGMAIMIASHLNGVPSEFPFSNNNDESEVR